MYRFTPLPFTALLAATQVFAVYEPKPQAKVNATVELESGGRTIWQETKIPAEKTQTLLKNFRELSEGKYEAISDPHNKNTIILRNLVKAKDKQAADDALKGELNLVGIFNIPPHGKRPLHNRFKPLNSKPQAPKAQSVCIICVSRSNNFDAQKLIVAGCINWHWFKGVVWEGEPEVWLAGFYFVH